MDVDVLYQQAENFLPWNLHSNICNSKITPYWSENALYYFQNKKSTNSLIRIDIQTGKKELILNYDKLLHDLFREVNANSQKSLSAFSIKETPEQLLSFTHNSYYWNYHIKEGICKQVCKSIDDQLISPNKKWALRIKEHNIILFDLITHKKFQITKDGQPYYDYASSPETNTHAITHRIQKIISKPVALWSPDSKKIITHKLDQRKVQKLFLLENAPKGSQRPKLHTYRMSFSGDENLPLAELMIIDIETKTIFPVNSPQLLAPYLTPLEFKWIWWNTNSQSVFFLQETRGAKELMLYEVDAKTGHTKLLLTEKAQKTYVEPNPHAPWTPQVLILEDRQQIIWLSERRGGIS